MGSNYYDIWSRLAPFRRLCEYYFTLLIGNGYAKERIMFNYSSNFKQRWEKEFALIRRTSIKEEFRDAVTSLLSSLFLFSFIIVLMIILYYKTSIGAVGTAFFITGISLIPTTYNTTLNKISNEINMMARQINVVKDYVKFINLSEESLCVNEPSLNSIVFNKIIFINVNLCYPGTEN